MNVGVKQISHSHRLWIGQISSLEQRENEFFIQESQVTSVIVQGVVVSVKQTDIVQVIVLDDATGTMDCVFYYKDFKPMSFIPGNIVRAHGRLGFYMNDISLKLLNPPYIVESIDEEIEWATSVNKLWNSVYTNKTFEDNFMSTKTPVQEFRVSKNKNHSHSGFYEVVKKIRNLEVMHVSYSVIQDWAQENTEGYIIEYIKDGFLIQAGDFSNLMESYFEVSSQPYHPEEILREYFRNSSQVIKIEDLYGICNGRFKDFTADILKSLHKLMEENLVYEVSDGEYALIVDSQIS
ncbi:hypothetical protein SteCoe_11647 [Stentor coeruleus]|uniref:OB domain-containing protein n=1 Tax=Stentor coeruleus TaxID=5963 RepID=A0A1R2CCQ5_9CILI|nr:hypothetical protein SteCoe_11647 [Stentor coeruleus]